VWRASTDSLYPPLSSVNWFFGCTPLPLTKTIFLHYSMLTKRLSCSKKKKDFFKKRKGAVF
jgi:hypothetical protein